MLIYGVCIDDVKKTKEDGIKELMKLYKYADGSTLYDEYVEWIEDNFGEEGSDPEANVDEFIMDFDNGCGYNGLGALLASVIEDMEGIDITVEDDNSGFQYVGIGADTPWNFNDKTKAMSEEEYLQILHKYMNMVTDEALEIRWWQANNGEY